jgi:hypothetical protein
MLYYSFVTQCHLLITIFVIPVALLMRRTMLLTDFICKPVKNEISIISYTGFHFVNISLQCSPGIRIIKGKAQRPQHLPRLL